MSLFITGTDTGVGKTHIAARLLRLLRTSGIRCAGMKPICCGDRRQAVTACRQQHFRRRRRLAGADSIRLLRQRFGRGDETAGSGGRAKPPGLS